MVDFTLDVYRKSQSRTGGIGPLTGGNRPRVETSPKIRKKLQKTPRLTCRNLQDLVTISVVGNLTDGKTSDWAESRPGRRRRPLTDGKTSDTGGKTSQFEMETVVLVVQQWQLAEMP